VNWAALLAKNIFFGGVMNRSYHGKKLPKPTGINLTHVPAMLICKFTNI
jgi:hypothetical protein